jgi:UDP-4-amino-4,6-dideoxy-N-acetyl-beta-L-altrosamine N-acetyltransferase
MSADRTTLRPAHDEEFATVLAWRNHPEVRRVMFTDHEIPEAEHLRWWSRVMADPDYRLLVVEHDARPCGVVTFSRLSDADHCWLWGFYLAPDAFADGLERLRAWNGMEVASLAYARDALGCREVRCEVFAFNTAVLQMHLRHRFVETGRYARPRGDETLDVVKLARTL